ncbi:hypothetical protein F9L00_21475 [Brucella anthropi]|uniref:hypothetical protein n=1 Tax=Brucella/Ochrobactrum group TaxID=2826938 RepID=UPI00124DCBAB|nr:MULTISPECIES: hypothetical protein [Brucella/Ochrobactrum group]KAB2774423.1 hypothetical protein F9L00_21475 [Brucella anthropi]MCQ9148345.1 hypothetical protein [Ochrobactrum sp. BTU2]
MMDTHIPALNLMAMGARFREERAHWRNDELSECLLLTADAIVMLEAGKLIPDAFLLFRMASSGLDVQYILTGIRSLNWFQVTADLNRFDAMEKESGHHTHAFEAIQSASPEVLGTIRDLIVDAVEQGWSLEQFWTVLPGRLNEISQRPAWR